MKSFSESHMETHAGANTSRHTRLLSHKSFLCRVPQKGQIKSQNCGEKPYLNQHYKNSLVEGSTVRYSTRTGEKLYKCGYVRNHLPTIVFWVVTWEHILDKIHTNASYVRKRLLVDFIWICMWEPMLMEKNDANASYVRNHMPTAVLSDITWELILAKSLTNVGYVRNRLPAIAN